MSHTSKKSAVKAIINCIPRGKVAYYGQVADVLASEFEIFMRGQLVGWCLASMGEEELKEVAWQRVIAKTGHIALLKLGLKGNAQIQLLEEEGVDVSHDFVDMTIYCISTKELIDSLKHQAISPLHS
jgi:alkylated DNA nucleotide flippase Atl1